MPPWAALFCASVVLRPQLTSFGPLIPRMQGDLRVSHAVAGIVPTAVLLTMGTSSLAAPVLVRRIGWRRTTTTALAVLGAAGIGRAFVPSIAGVIILSAPIGAGAGLAGVSLPTAVADLFRERRELGTAIHALGINIGATAAAAVAVPLAVLPGGWRSSLGCLALIGIGLSLLWEPGARSRSARTRPTAFELPLRDVRAWSLTSVFALQGLCYYGFGAWLSDAYVERGWSQSAGGGLVAAMTATAVPASFAFPRAAEHFGSRLRPLFTCAVALLLGAIVLATSPSLAWPGIVLVGTGLGGLFSLCLLLAVDLGRTSNRVSGFTGMMLGLGYTMSAAAPVLLGVARDAAGSFGAALWLIVAIAGALVVLLVAARRLLLAPDSVASGFPEDS